MTHAIRRMHISAGVLSRHWDSFRVCSTAFRTPSSSLADMSDLGCWFNHFRSLGVEPEAQLTAVMLRFRQRWCLHYVSMLICVAYECTHDIVAAINHVNSITVKHNVSYHLLWSTGMPWQNIQLHASSNHVPLRIHVDITSRCNVLHVV